MTNLADLFTKVLPKPRREYNLNKFTYLELRTYDKSIISGVINSHPGDYPIKLKIIGCATSVIEGTELIPSGLNRVSHFERELRHL